MPTAIGPSVSCSRIGTVLPVYTRGILMLPLDLFHWECWQKFFDDGLVFLRTQSPTYSPNISRYISSWKPTKSVVPSKSVGARRLPVGPIITASSSAWLAPFGPKSKRVIVLPLAATNFLALAARASASSGPLRTFEASTI